MKRYWKTSAFSLTARIPNSHVTPKTGSNVPSDLSPDLFQQTLISKITRDVVFYIEW